MDKTPAPQSHVSIPLQLPHEVLELMRLKYSAHIFRHGDARAAMNAAYMALVKHYKEK